MAHDVSAAFTTASEASVNDVAYDVLVGWLKQYNSAATFFQIDHSHLDGTDFLKGYGDDVTFFDKYEYNSEAANVISWDISRKTNLYPYGVFIAQANVVLDNTSKKYLPGYDATIGAYIKPSRPLRIYAGFDKEIVQQFGGFTDIPSNTLVQRQTSLTAMDVMNYFETTEAITNYFEGMLWNEIVEALLIEQGFSSAQYNLEPSTQPAIGYLSTSGVTLADIFRKGCEAEQATMFCDEMGIIQLWNRFHYQDVSTLAKSLTYDTVNDVDYVDTPIINYVRVLAKPRSVRALQPVWQSDWAIQVAPGATVTVPINFVDDDGPMPVTAVLDPIFVASDKSDGSGTPSVDVIMSDFRLIGDTAFIDFENTGDDNMYVTSIQIQGTPAKVTGKIIVEYKDQTSINANGINPSDNGKVIEITNDWIQNHGTARALAYTMVDEYKDANQQLLVKPFPDPSLMYGDLIEMTIDDVDVYPRTCFLVGTRLSSDLSAILYQELTLDERNIRSYFRIDVSELDGTDVLAA